MLKGDLTATPLAPLLVDLANEASTGCLLITETTGEEATVYFKAGLVYAVSVPGSRPQLGSKLVSSGALAPEALAEALEAQRMELQGWRLGELLVHLGYVDQPVVEAFIKEQVSEALWDLLRWTTGRWKFRKNIKAREDVGPPMVVVDLLESLRERGYEWETISAVVHGPNAVPRLSTRNDSSTETILDNDAWSMLCKIDGERSVADLARDCGYTLFEAGHVIVSLVQAGLVDIDEEIDVEGAELYGATTLSSALSGELNAQEDAAEQAAADDAIARLARLVSDSSDDDITHGETASDDVDPSADGPTTPMVVQLHRHTTESFAASIARVSNALSEVLGDAPEVTEEDTKRKDGRRSRHSTDDPEWQRRKRLRTAAAAELASAQALVEALRPDRNGAAKPPELTDEVPRLVSSEDEKARVAAARDAERAERRREQKAAEKAAEQEAKAAEEAELTRLEAERIAAEEAAARLEAERIAAEEAELTRLEAERIAAEEAAEAERIAAEEAAEAERVEAERIAAEEEAARLEAERIAAEEAAEAERVEAERIAAEEAAEAERVEAERIAAEEEAARLEAERIAAEEAAEAERVEAERIAAEEEAARLEAERIAAEEEAARLEAERIAAERIAAEEEAARLEAERIAAEEAAEEEAARLEAERIAAEEAAEAERLEAERIAAEEEAARLEAERIAAEEEAARLEAERIAAEDAELARLDAERVAAEQAAEAERIAAEAAEFISKAERDERLEEERLAAAEEARRQDEAAAAMALLAEHAATSDDYPDTNAPTDEPALADVAAPNDEVREPVSVGSGYNDADTTDTAALLRELSSLGNDDRPSEAPPTTTRAPRTTATGDKKTKKKIGLFGL